MTGTEKLLQETELQPLLNHIQGDRRNSEDFNMNGDVPNSSTQYKDEADGTKEDQNIRAPQDVPDTVDGKEIEVAEIAKPASEFVVGHFPFVHLPSGETKEKDKPAQDHTDYEKVEKCEDLEPCFSWDSPAVTEELIEASPPPTDSTAVATCYLSRSTVLEEQFCRLFHAIHYHESKQMNDILKDEEDYNIAVLLTKRNQEGIPCLMKAVARQSLNCIQSLLGHLEKTKFSLYNYINKLDAFESEDGRNVFHFAAEMVRDKEVINSLDIELDMAEQLANKATPKCGVTPLIVACMSQNHLMAQRLVNYKAKIDCVDNFGDSPIYWATSTGSAETLKFFLVHGARETRDQLRLFKRHDLYKQKGTILQAIVESRCSKTLQVCLEIDNGREHIIECLKEELELDRTFIHAICETPLVSLVELAIEAKTDMVLKREDADGITPLMKATEAGQLDVVKLILSKYSGRSTLPRSKKSTKETSLMIACKKGFYKIVEFIMESGDEEIKLNQLDNDSKNAFHHAANHDEILPLMVDICRRMEKYKNYKEYLQQKDNDGYVALHIAAVRGKHENVKVLLNNDVPYDTPSAGVARTALHYAVCSNLSTVKVLLDFVEKHCSEDDMKKYIDAEDSRLQTSLHIAASLQKYQTVSFLLEKGATIKCDNENDTALHLAAYAGCEKTVKLLIQSNPSIIHWENRVGETAAMFAAINGQTKVLKMLLDKNAELWVESGSEGVEKRRTCLDWAVLNNRPETAKAILENSCWKKTMEKSFFGADGLLAEMVKTMPSVAIKVLNKCRTEYDDKTVYDFFALQTEEVVSTCRKTTRAVTSMKALETMATSRRNECLSHDVVQKFLDQKWALRAEKWYMLCLFIYTLFLISLTTYITLITEDSSASPCLIAGVICYIFAITSVIKELFQLFHRGLSYFCCWSSYLDLIMYICVFIFLPYNEKSNLQRQAGAIAIFLGWINYTWFLKRFQTLGIYIIMAKKIFVTFLKVFVPISFIIIAFSMTFYVLLHNKDDDNAFENIVLSFVTTFAMMGGEVNYRDSFLRQSGNNFVLLMFFLVLFLVLMSILLMNLLTGLAVGDIGVIMKRSLAEKRELQAMLIVDMDKYLSKYPGLETDLVKPLAVDHQEKKGCRKMLKDRLFPSFDVEEEKNKRENCQSLSRVEERINVLQSTLDEIKHSLQQDTQHRDPVSQWRKLRKTRMSAIVWNAPSRRNTIV